MIITTETQLVRTAYIILSYIAANILDCKTTQTLHNIIDVYAMCERAQINRRFPPILKRTLMIDEDKQKMQSLVTHSHAVDWSDAAPQTDQQTTGTQLHSHIEPDSRTATHTLTQAIEYVHISIQLHTDQ